MTIKRGDIYYADLSPVVGSEQGGTRPVLIVQNNVGNKYSPTVIAAAITSQKYKTQLPTHISVHADNCGLQKDSIVLLEQVRTLDKSGSKSEWAISPKTKWPKLTTRFRSVSVFRRPKRKGRQGAVCLFRQIRKEQEETLWRK